MHTYIHMGSHYLRCERKLPVTPVSSFTYNWLVNFTLIWQKMMKKSYYF